MKGANVLAIAVIAVIVLALVAKGKEPPVEPVLPPEPEPPPEEPIVIRPAPPLRPEPPPAPPVTPPGEIIPLPNPVLEHWRRFYVNDLRRRARRGGEKWIAAEREYLLATNPGMPGSVDLTAIVTTWREIVDRVGKSAPRPPVRPPVTPPAPEPEPPPAPIPVATWRWHDEPRSGRALMNPRTGQVVIGISRSEERALRRAGWIGPTARQIAWAERRYRAPGVPRIPEEYLPPGYPEIPGLPRPI